MTRERRKVEPVQADHLDGDYEAVCLGAETRTASTGSECVVWTFLVEGLRLSRWTVKRRMETGETAGALGLGRRFKLSAAADKRCIVTVSFDGLYHSIDRCRPLGNGPL